MTHRDHAGMEPHLRPPRGEQALVRVELRAPAGLTAWIAEEDQEPFALLEWPETGALPVQGLTAAERDVARLAARGLSNREIAASRGTSVRTVANQVASVFVKLGVGSRRELAARGGSSER